jgi:hypothetical protein
MDCAGGHKRAIAGLHPQPRVADALFYLAGHEIDDFVAVGVASRPLGQNYRREYLKRLPGKLKR